MSAPVSAARASTRSSAGSKRRGKGVGTAAARLAPAFVVTVGLALQIAACGGNVDDGSGPGLSGAGTGGTGGSTGSGKGGSGGNDPGCPASQPYAGNCSGSLVCTYPQGSCGPATSSCVDGKWLSTSVSCNPPPPACPDGDIVEGAACPGGGFGRTTCPRTVDGCKLIFVCEGTWKKDADSCAVCPSAAPAVNDACPSAGLSCDYQLNGCPLDLVCQSGSWISNSPPCNPPQPAAFCPDQEPTAGASCVAGPPGDPDCTYLVGGCVDRWRCGGDQRWTLFEKACDETAPPACEARLDQTSCAGDADCRWLWPGCASGSQTKLPAAGCFPAKGCTTDAECPGSGPSCKQVVVDPCHDAACAACGKVTGICQ